MFALRVQAAIEAAPRTKLSEIGETVWKAWSQGVITDAEAQDLSDIITARKALPVPQKPIQRRVGSRARSPASVERRRSWAASGYLPPNLAARFTASEVAVLAVIAAEVVKGGDCRLAIDHIAALAGVGRTTAKRALHEAQALGLIKITERKITGWRNDTNVVSVVCSAWRSWLRLRRGGGVQFVTGTHTKNKNKTETRSPHHHSKGYQKDKNPSEYG